MSTTPSAPDHLFIVHKDGPLRAARSISGRSLPRVEDTQIRFPGRFWTASVLLTVAMLGGGGRGGLGDLLAQLLAVGQLALLLSIHVRQGLHWRSQGWVALLPALALLLPVIQLLPIPESLWLAAPARSQLAAQLAHVGVAPHSVISLNPGATERALWSMLPATALFLTALTLPRASQRRLVILVLCVVIASVLLALAQLADGPQSTLRLYRPTNPTEAVGFFANKNHFACLLAMALPIALAGTAWAVSDRLAGGRVPVPWIIAGCGIVILLVLGLALARSRAGLLLGMLAVLGTFPLGVSVRRQRGAKRILALTLGIAVMLSVQFGLFGLLQSVQRDPLDDGRWQYAHFTREAAVVYSPLGSGLGTFRQAYQPFEATGQPASTIVNHAHDDYLELWLEGGLPALLLLAIGLGTWAWCGFQLWSRRVDAEAPEFFSSLLTRAAWLAASLGLLHSALDYPLRTTANMSVFAILAAIAFTGVRGRLNSGTNTDRAE